MPKVLVIPDVHLKPAIFDSAEAILKAGKADMAIQLGDLVDDWGQGANVELYKATLERAIKFSNDFPTTAWIIGNHEVSYLGDKHCAGYSLEADTTVRENLVKLYNLTDRVAYVTYMLDNCIFSHAGITTPFYTQSCLEAHLRETTTEQILHYINRAPAYLLWQPNSPLWARMTSSGEHSGLSAFRNTNFIQIVGHTPVHTPTFDKDQGVLFTDTWSTYSDGRRIGDRILCVIDTEHPDLVHLTRYTVDGQLALTMRPR